MDANEQLVPADGSERMLERQFQWFKAHRGGMSFEDIARQELPDETTKFLIKKKAKQIERSVKEVQATRAFATAQEVDTTQQHTVVNLAGLEEKRLKEALDATMIVEEDAKFIRVPDWDTRLTAMKLLNEKYAIIAKKTTTGSPMVVAVQQNAPPGKSGPSNDIVQTQATSFEEVIRRVQRNREQNGARQPADEGKLLGGAPSVIEGA